MRYRIRKRDGAYIWVNDIGKKSWNENGGFDCIGVVRDITDEMVMKRRWSRKAYKGNEGRGIQPYFRLRFLRYCSIPYGRDRVE